MADKQKRYKFVMSDESVNAYGSRVLTDGIDLTSFKKNPVALFMHSRYELPIGRWENVRVEDSKLVGELVLVEGDTDVDKLALRLDQGVYNAVSIGFTVVSLSDDPEDLIVGQTAMTITKSVLSECSLVDIPANKNAVKLFDVDGEYLELKAGGELPAYMRLHATTEEPGQAEETTEEEEKPHKKEKEMDLVQLCALLGLSADSTEKDVTAKLAELTEGNTELADAQEEVTKLRAQLKEVEDAKVATLLASHRTSGVVTDENEDAFKELAMANFESTEKILTAQAAQLEKNKPKVSKGFAANLAAPEVDQDKTKTYSWYAENDPKGLAELKATDFDGEYARLVEEEFGVKPSK